jgi:hypothetical protein
VKFIRRADELEGDDVIYLTNYESVREGILDIGAIEDLVAVSLDEAAILRGFGGTKTFRESMAVFAGDDRRDKSQRVKSDGVPFRFVATATPDPNEHIELLAYAAFLGVMDIGQAKTRFFKRNSEKADQLTLHPHKEARVLAVGRVVGAVRAAARATSASRTTATSCRRFACTGTSCPATTHRGRREGRAGPDVQAARRSACRTPRARSATACRCAWPRCRSSRAATTARASSGAT